jgi:Ca2+-binding RTX toxin-like protein
MSYTIGLGLLGNATQWVLPGLSTLPLPDPPPGAPPPVADAITETLVAPPAPILAFGGLVQIIDGPFNVVVDVLGAWNSVKNGTFTAAQAGNVTMSGFVHADVALGGGGDSTVRLIGAKRGNVVTAEGDDVISIEVATNGAAWVNEFRINADAGNDLVTVGALDIAAAALIDATFASTANRAGAFTGNDAGTLVIAALGAGDDQFVGLGLSRDRVSGGSGDDILIGGKGDDVLGGGTGADIFVFATGDGADRIDDFAIGEDRIIFRDLDIAEIEAVLDGAIVEGGGTLLVHGDSSVFLAGITTPLSLSDLL